MPRKLAWMVVLGAAIIIATLYVRNARATAGSGFVATTLYRGTFGEIDVFNQFIPPRVANDENREESPQRDIWLSWQKTKGSSDLFVQRNDWAPAGTTGWHTHPGHSLIIVTAGTVTAYEGNDPDCKPHVYTSGMTFVDPGGDHVHIVRNEGNVAAQTIAIQLIPVGQPRRIDVADPGNCHF